MKNFLTAIALVALSLVTSVFVAQADDKDLAYRGILELPTLAGTAIDPTADYLPVYDGSTGLVSKVLYDARSTTPVTLTGDTTLTAATHSGRLLLLGEVGGDAQLTATLPAATGSGRVYTFTVSVVNTSNYVITRAGSDVIRGSLLYASDNASNAAIAFEAAGASTITLNGTTKGGALIGDRVMLLDCLSGVWCVSGQVTETGSEATPFS